VENKKDACHSSQQLCQQSLVSFLSWGLTLSCNTDGFSSPPYSVAKVWGSRQEGMCVQGERLGWKCRILRVFLEKDGSLRNSILLLTYYIGINPTSTSSSADVSLLSPLGSNYLDSNVRTIRINVVINFQICLLAPFSTIISIS
jgi:hypothetical protein